MSELNIESMHSLPPQVPGKITHILIITAKSIILNPKDSKTSLRIQWWGDVSTTRIYSSNASTHLKDPVNCSDTARFTIKCTKKQFGVYLNDMGSLPITVFSNGRVVGMCHVSQLKDLLKKKGVVDTKYPICKDEDASKVKIGEVHLVIELVPFTFQTSQNKINKDLDAKEGDIDKNRFNDENSNLNVVRHKIREGEKGEMDPKVLAERSKSLVSNIPLSTGKNQISKENTTKSSSDVINENDPTNENMIDPNSLRALNITTDLDSQQINKSKSTGFQSEHLREIPPVPKPLDDARLFDPFKSPLISSHFNPQNLSKDSSFHASNSPSLESDM